MKYFLLASDHEWGKNFGDWVARQALGVAIGISVVVLAIMIARRAWSQLVVTIIICAIVIAIIANPSFFVNIGKIILSILLGDDAPQSSIIGL